jgi:hypothetical protein
VHGALTDTATETGTVQSTAGVSVVDTTVFPNDIASLDPVYVSAHVENTGDATGQAALPLVVNGSTRRTRTVTLDPGGVHQVEFAFRPSSVGTYETGIGNATSTVEAREPSRALPSFAQPRDELDSTVVSSNSEGVLLSSLQGIVNARRPRILLSAGPDWAETLGIPTDARDPWDLIASYSHEASGIVVYDPDRPHTVNAATTVAGVERALVAAPGQASRLEGMGLDVIRDFREMDAITANRVDLYTWLLEEYWDRTADRIVTGLPPVAGDGTDPHWQFRDYAVAVTALTIWLDPHDGDHVALLDEITSRMPVPGSYLGWWPDEVAGVRQVSEGSVHTGAADFLTSSTVWSGTGPTDPGGWPDRLTDPAVPDLQDTVYVTFTITEGDNLQYCQNKLKSNWDDDARGTVPINWSISPLLADIAPGLLAYYFETATDNDHFMCGPTGLGYTYPRDWNPTDRETFFEWTGEYLDELDIETLYALNRLGIDSTLSPGTVADIEAHTDISGVALGWNGPETTRRGDDLLVSKGLGGLGDEFTVDSIVSELEGSIPADWSGDRPLFRSVGLFGFDMTPTDVVAITDRLGQEFEVVRGDVFFELARSGLSQ